MAKSISLVLSETADGTVNIVVRCPKDLAGAAGKSLMTMAGLMIANARNPIGFVPGMPKVGLVHIVTRLPNGEELRIPLQAGG